MTSWTASASIDFLRHRGPNRPFFLFSSFFGPHHPYAVPGTWNGRHDPADVDLSERDIDLSANPIFAASKMKSATQFREAMNERDYRQCIAAYYDNIAMIDHYVGRILDELRQQGIWENTCIVFCSDHGDHIGRYGLFFKGDMYDTAARVPLMVKPAHNQGNGGRRCDTVVNTLDLYGTLLEMAGNDRWQAEPVESRSLLPLLRQPGGDEDGETYAILAGKSQRGVAMCRSGSLKLIRMARTNEPPSYELYDREAESIEQHNVYDDPSYQEARDALQRKLDDWWSTQCDRYPAVVRTHRL